MDNVECRIDRMNHPQNWRYEGEGGKHVVFSFHPSVDDEDGSSDNVVPTVDGCLLRLDKSELVLAASSRGDVEKMIPELNIREKGSKDGCLVYAREVVRPRLSAYVDIPLIAVLNTAFAVELKDLASQSVPDERRKDWNNPGGQIKLESPRNLTAELWSDYRLLHTLDGTFADRATFCFEVKPKAGYLSVSPLVDPKRRIKYLVSRFRIFQHLTEQKNFCKSWMKPDNLATFQVSLYDPVDLFSGERERISRAVSHLIHAPQNNLVVWKGRELVLGRSGSCHDAVDWRGLLESLEVDTEKLDQSTARDEVIDLVSAVLEVEPCLNSLLKLQRLDVLDGDGAALVYRRLVDLCQGSHETAEGLLSKDPILLSKESDEAFFIGASPFGLSQQARRNVLAYCDKVKSFSKLLESSRPKLPLAQLMDNARIDALKLVSVLSLEECVYFLQNWLLSLSMCDVSLFITFHGTEKRRRENDRATPPALRPSVVQLQQDRLPGIVEVPHTGNHSSACLGYYVRIIDFDRKPAKKLRTRLLKETCIDGVDLERCY